MMRMTFNGRQRVADFVTGSLLRCHLIGVAASLVLMVGTGWIWSLRHLSVDPVMDGATVVDLGEAARLVANAESWHRQYADGYRQSEQLQQAAQQVSTWLPVAINAAQAEADIRSLAEENQVTLLSWTAGESQLGTRCGVLLVQCEVDATYPALCRFLAAISGELTTPAIVSEITVQRAADRDRDEQASGDPPTVRCTAAIGLRLPFAAAETAAGDLIAGETKLAN